MNMNDENRHSPNEERMPNKSQPKIRTAALVIAAIILLSIFLVRCGGSKNKASEGADVSGVSSSTESADESTNENAKESTSIAVAASGTGEPEEDATPQPPEKLDANITATLSADTSLWSSLSEAEEIATLTSGETVEILDYDDPLWCHVIAGENEGYVYADLLKKDSSSVSILSESLTERIKILSETYPAGRYWNHMESEPGGYYSTNVTDTPCDHDYIGYEYCNHYDGVTLNYFAQYGSLTQCLGFASMTSDYLFGTSAPLNFFYSAEHLRVGDHIRFTYYEHSVIVIEVNETGIVVAEVNRSYEDCLIEWGRTITFEELNYSYGGGVEYLTRCPELPSPNERATAIEIEIDSSDDDDYDEPVYEERPRRGRRG